MSDPDKRDEAAAQGMTDVRALPGVDAAAGLRACLGNENLYRRLLVRFLGGESDFAARFAAAVGGADLVVATRCAHSLKGSAGNLGIRGVQAAAACLETACLGGAAREEIMAGLARVADELELVLSGLRQLDRGSGEGGARPPRANPMSTEGGTK